MKLSIPFLNNKKADKGYYLALILDDEKASSVILEEESEKIKIVGKHTEHFTSPLETIPQEDLVKIIDKTISKAEEVLPPNIETHKTIFGVKESWVEPDSKKIKKEYLAKLKNVCDALDLSPIGFMVINEAIANIIQRDEGSPLSAILIEAGIKTAHVTLFRGGKVSESGSGPIEHSIPVVIDNLLKTFTAPVLPTKILLFHTKGAKELTQHFMNHEWSKGLPFLHVPQVSVLPEDYESRAVTYGASQQMGFEMLDLSDKTPPLPTPTDEKNDQVQEEENILPITPSPAVVENFGFVLDQDIANQPVKAAVVEIASEKELEESSEIESDNFEKIDDFIEEKPFHTELQEEPIVISSDESSENKLPPTRKKNLFAGIFASLPKIPLPKIGRLLSFFSKNKGLKLPLIIIGAILIIGIGITIFYFYNVKAQVVLSVKPKAVTQDTNVTFSTTGSSDFSKNIIAAHSVSASIDGETSTEATGKKDTGNKAKGSVTIYNNSDSSVSLSSGTSLKSNNNLIFTTDKDISIASASGDIFSGTKPGTAQVNVTAKDVGTESNLPSAAKFTVGSNSSLAAKNDSAFSGGSKKTITVVSAADLTKLKSELPKSLEKKAAEDLSKKIGSDETLLPGFSNTTLEKPKFDKGVDDEAKQVKLNATVNFEAMSYQNEDLENFEKSILKDHYSQDISFADETLKNEIKDAKVKNDKELNAKLKITAGLLPKIDNNEVANKLKNKSAKEAKEILSSLPQVAGSEIKFSPNILFLSSLFPTLPKNISVVVKSHE